MKSLFLEHVIGLAQAEAALDEELPGQRRPWLLRALDGDAIAYLNAESHLDGEPNVHVSADLSGRWFGREYIVTRLLERLESRIGGNVAHDA